MINMAYTYVLDFVERRKSDITRDLDPWRTVINTQESVSPPACIEASTASYIWFRPFVDASIRVGFIVDGHEKLYSRSFSSGPKSW